jgi:hypothetical protein
MIFLEALMRLDTSVSMKTISDIAVYEDLKYQYTFTHILWYNK